MYLSILEPRQRDIGRADFKNAPCLLFNESCVEDLRGHDLDVWNRYIRYAPRQIYDVLTAGYGIESMPIAVTMTDDAIFRVSTIENSGVPFKAFGEFGLGRSPEVLANEIKVVPMVQGLGIGRTWFRAMVELSVAFGFSAFNFNAGLGNGGYTWAKAGAYMDRDRQRNPLYHEEAQYLSENMLARLEVAKAHIPSANYERAHALCRLACPGDMVKLAGMGDLTVPRDVLHKAKPVLVDFYSSLSLEQGGGAMTRLRTCEEYGRLVQVFNDPSGGFLKRVSLPHYLQKLSIWNAVVDFADERQMVRVGDYVGGWRYIKRVASDGDAVKRNIQGSSVSIY